MIYRIKEGFVLRQIVDTWIAVPSGSSSTDLYAILTLSDTAVFLWNMLSDGCDIETLVKNTTDEYDIDESQARIDIEKTLEILRSNNILEEQL